MSPYVEIRLRGSPVRLLAGKALYFPEHRTLCIADAHFGKAAAYRALGQPVPGGTTATNLARIDALLAAQPVSHLVFLGDLLHARASLTPSIVSSLRGWRCRHPSMTCTLVRGNHDRRAGDPPASLGIDVVDEPFSIGPYALCHAPRTDLAAHVIAGHVHPVFDLLGRARQRLRLPCFVSNDKVTILPSFGDFTGGYNVEAGRDDRIFVTDGAGIWPVNA